MKTAITRIVVTKDDGTERTGTGFLVSGQYILTAFHVVGERVNLDVITPKIFTRIIVYFDHAAFKTAATVVPGAFDVLSDWALVRIDETPLDVSPIPLGTIQNDEYIEFKTWGYPITARLSQSSLALDGYIQDPNSQYQGVPALQLYCHSAAAGLADPLNGLSGAPCIVENCAIGIIRSNLVAVSASNMTPHIVGGVLYACPIDIPTIRERCVNLIPPIDPIRGLPGIPPSALPSAPFRYLHWYGPAEAEVFFGRHSLIRQIFLALTDENSPHITFVYGASGVGKSSLIRAAVASRLHGTHIVLNAQCDANTEVSTTLATALESSANGDLRKRLVVLDQLDEALIGSNQSTERILSDFASDLGKIVEVQSHIRVIILFRSEWLAQIRSRFDEYALARHEFHIERPGRADICAIVRGVASTPRLCSFYRTQVDKQLETRIADDLLSDPNSPITPLLSIVMTKLWASSQLEDGSRHLSVVKYEEQMRERISLRGFIDEQLNALLLWRREDIENGLVTSVLFELTTTEGTARSVSLMDLRKKFQHLDVSGKTECYVDNVLADISRCSLSHAEPTQHGTDVTYRLAHDTLAPIVREDFFRSSLPGQRAERILSTRSRDYDQEVFVPLDDGDLALVEKGLRGMRSLSSTEAIILAKSRDERRIRAKRKQILRIAAIFATTTIIFLAVTSFVFWQTANNIYRDSIKQRAHGLADLSRLKMSSDTGAALQLALAAAKFDSFLEPSKLIQQALQAPPEWTRVESQYQPEFCNEMDLLGSDSKPWRGIASSVIVSKDFTSQVEFFAGSLILRGIPNGNLLSKTFLKSNETIWNQTSIGDLLITMSENIKSKYSGIRRPFEYSVYALNKNNLTAPVAKGKAIIVATSSGSWPVVSVNETGNIEVHDADGSVEILNVTVDAPTQLFVAPGGSAAVIFERDQLHWIALDGSGNSEIIAWPNLDKMSQYSEAVTFLAWGPDYRRFFIANADDKIDKLRISAVSVDHLKHELLIEAPYKFVGLNRPIFEASPTGTRIMWSINTDDSSGPNIGIADIIWPDDSSSIQLKNLPVQTIGSEGYRKFPTSAKFSPDGNRLILAEDVNVREFYGVGKLSILEYLVGADRAPGMWVTTRLTVGPVFNSFSNDEYQGFTCKLSHVGFSQDAKTLVAVDGSHVSHYFRLGLGVDLIPDEWSLRLEEPEVSSFGQGRYRLIVYGDKRAEIADIKKETVLDLTELGLGPIMDARILNGGERLVLADAIQSAVYEQGRLTKRTKFVKPAKSGYIDNSLITVLEESGKYRFYSQNDGSELGELLMDENGVAFRDALKNVSKVSPLRMPFWYSSPWKKLTSESYKMVLTDNGWIVDWLLTYDAGERLFKVNRGTLNIDYKKLAEGKKYMSMAWNSDAEIVFVQSGKNSELESEVLQWDSITGERVDRFLPSNGWPPQTLALEKSFNYGGFLYLILRAYSKADGQHFYIGSWNLKGGYPVRFTDLGEADQIISIDTPSATLGGTLTLESEGNWKLVTLDDFKIIDTWEDQKELGIGPFFEHFSDTWETKGSPWLGRLAQHVAMRNPTYWSNVSLVPVKEIESMENDDKAFGESILTRMFLLRE